MDLTTTVIERNNSVLFNSNSLTFERMKRSLLMFLGSSARYFIVLKNRTDMISATLQHDVGYLGDKEYTLRNKGSKRVLWLSP
jgi:hypothetical protein